MKATLIGPFSEIVTLDNLPLRGPLKDSSLVVIPDGGIMVENGRIKAVGPYARIKTPDIKLEQIETPATAIPGLIDAHTHICFAGSRADEYAKRLSGTSYLEIAAGGGGILRTVRETRLASEEELVESTLKRIDTLLQRGITTCEIKSGYGLSAPEELKMLRAIKRCALIHPVSIVPTCLAAHTKPWEFESPLAYLNYLLKDLLPLVLEEKLASRLDIFVEKDAFPANIARDYMLEGKKAGFSLVVHANQFTSGGAELAADIGALSADHLEVLTESECRRMASADVVATVLPGASLGLGMPFAPARMMLDEGLTLAIASDWNPGSAPMGDLLTQAALLGAMQKLTMAETLSGITNRAARALGMNDRGVLAAGMRADIAIFPCKGYQEILYHQGSMHPSHVYIKGESYKYAGAY